MKAYKVPEATVLRLTSYARFLSDCEEKGIETLSSLDIANAVGVTPAQVRKDLAYFGEFGTRGVGYNIKELIKQIEIILGLDKAWNVIIVGAGNLGRALMAYKGFNKRGVEIVGAFDTDKGKLGDPIGNLKVEPIESIPDRVKESGCELAIIAVPANAAQETANCLVEAGIKGIINFAPYPIVVPHNVTLQSVDLASKLEVLTYYLRDK